MQVSAVVCKYFWLRKMFKSALLSLSKEIFIFFKGFDLILIKRVLAGIFFFQREPKRLA